jgi:hypothetical protein
VIECKQKRIPAIPLNVISIGVNLNGTQVFVTVHSRTSFTAELEGGEGSRFARSQLAAPAERQVNSAGHDSIKLLPGFAV